MLVASFIILLINALIFINIPTVQADSVAHADERIEITSQRKIKAAQEAVLDNDEFLEILPPHLRRFSNNAGGHTDMLKDIQSGNMLKKMKGEKQLKEKRFYDEVEKGNYPELAPLIPAYFGVEKVTVNGKTVDYLTLKDQTHGFEKACVLDVKIGNIIWGPDAPEAKKEKKSKHWKLCRETYGFCLNGYIIRYPGSDDIATLSREECATLGTVSIVDEIEKFVHSTKDSQATVILVKHILRELDRIIQWVDTQTGLRLYTTSIIIVYDSEKLLEKEKYLEAESLDFLRVKIVDFVHNHKVPKDDGIDTNYRQGVRSLKKIFTNILKKHTSLMSQDGTGTKE